jgi:hypothetical protein
MRAFAILGLLGVALVIFPAEAASQAFRVVVVPDLELRDLERLERRAAVGLLVPGAGPETSEPSARAALERGKVRNSLRNGVPAGPPLILVETATGPPAEGPAIVLALPRGGDQPNDRRYPIAVLGQGFGGLLTSKSTRIPGLVSIADVAPTALGRAGALGSQAEAGAADELERLDRRIDTHNDARKTASRLAALAVLALALIAPRAAVLGVAALVLVNLVLGVAGAESEWIPIAALPLAVIVGGLVAAAGARSAGAVGFALAATLAAYLVAFLVDERWIALSPLGPTQNARFYGVSNLLETLLLVPALVGGAVLARRHLALLGAVAALAFVVVAGNRFGADGGGAVVLGAGFLVLAATLAGLRGRRLALTVAASVALITAVLALEAATGTTSHVTRALEGGPSGLAADLRDRISLSYARATEHRQNAAIVLGGIAAFVLLAARLLRLPTPLAERALPVAFLAAIATSLVVNDSPVEVVITGLACYLAVEAYALRTSSVLEKVRRLEHVGGLARLGRP